MTKFVIMDVCYLL